MHTCKLLYNQQTRFSQGCFTNTFVTNSYFIQSSFSSHFLKHGLSQAVRAMELKFGEKAHPPSCVTCHVSRVRYCMSHVMCHMSSVLCHIIVIFWVKMVDLVRVGSVINRAYPVQFYSILKNIYIFGKYHRTLSWTTRPSVIKVLSPHGHFLSSWTFHNAENLHHKRLFFVSLWFFGILSIRNWQKTINQLKVVRQLLDILHCIIYFVIQKNLRKN